MKVTTLLVVFLGMQALYANDCDDKQENCGGKEEEIPLSYNFDCQYYQDAIVSSQKDSSAFYSQAPTGQSLGQCNVIPCLGSPIFVIEKAHQWIEQQFDLSNSMSSARLIAYKRDQEKGAYYSIKYHLAFELTNYSGSKYIGVLLDSPIQGYGSAKYLKVVMNANLDLVLEIVGLGRSDVSDINCGDLKLIFSHYNSGSSSEFAYGYNGKNFNEVQQKILEEVHKAQAPSKGKVCSNEHYVRAYDVKTNNFFRDETSIITPPLRENFYCQAEGNSVDRIRIGCRTFGNWQPDNFEAFQLVRKDASGKVLYGPIQGDQGIAERYFKDISLTGAAEVAIEFWGADKADLKLQRVREEIRVVTYDSRGKQIDEIRCGEYFDHNKQSQVRISVNDFLGFWYNFDGQRNIQRLGVISYK